MVNICSVVDEDLEDTEFVALVKDYSVSESRIQSTQKPIETNYQEQEFWDRVEKFQLIRIDQDCSIIAKATKNLVWGILSNKDKSAILTLAARLACYIKVYNSTKIYMLDIKEPDEETSINSENTETGTTDTTPRTVDGLSQLEQLLVRIFPWMTIVGLM